MWALLWSVPKLLVRDDRESVCDWHSLKIVSSIRTRLVCHVQQKVTVEVVCDQTPSMSGEGSSPEVRVFMIEQEVLWYEFEHGFSQQGSSSEGNPFANVPSAGHCPKPEPDRAVE